MSHSLTCIIGSVSNSITLIIVFFCFGYEWMHSTAEKNKIPWREMTKEILESDVYKELDTIQNKSLVYPDCNFILLLFFLFFFGIACFNFHVIRWIFCTDYLNPFHAYDEGNLTWLVSGNGWFVVYCLNFKLILLMCNMISETRWYW